VEVEVPPLFVKVDFAARSLPPSSSGRWIERTKIEERMVRVFILRVS
jgi:hypothetical protein